MQAFLKSLMLVFTVIALPGIAADTFPSRPIRFVIPAPPGGGTDAVGRIVGTKLTELWGQQVVIDNRGGAQGGIATALVAKAAPDGYTILFAYTGPISVNPHLYKDPGYNALKDFAAVTRLTQQPMLLTAHPAVPATNMKELVAFAKQNPGKLSFASSASGQQVAGELLKLATGTNILHVPYKGAGPAVLDLLGGNVNLMISNPTSVVPHIKAGRLRAIGVLGGKRIEALPDVPTAPEAGYPELGNVIEWYGVVAPAATPKPVVAALNAGFLRALASSDVLQRLNQIGLTASPSTPEDFDRQIREDFARWGKVVKASGAKLD